MPRGACLAAAPFAVKVLLAVSHRIGRRTGAVFGSTTLWAFLRLQQRAVDPKMLTRQQSLHLWLGLHGGEKLDVNLARQQAVEVHGEGGGMPDRVDHAQADEPTEQWVELGSADQLGSPNGSCKMPATATPLQPLR